MNTIEYLSLNAKFKESINSRCEYDCVCDLHFFLLLNLSPFKNHVSGCIFSFTESFRAKNFYERKECVEEFGRILFQGIEVPESRPRVHSLFAPSQILSLPLLHSLAHIWTRFRTTERDSRLEVRIDFYSTTFIFLCPSSPLILSLLFFNQFIPHFHPLSK